MNGSLHVVEMFSNLFSCRINYLIYYLFSFLFKLYVFIASFLIHESIQILLNKHIFNVNSDKGVE